MSNDVAECATVMTLDSDAPLSGQCRRRLRNRQVTAVPAGIPEQCEFVRAAVDFLSATTPIAPGVAW